MLVHCFVLQYTCISPVSSRKLLLRYQYHTIFYDLTPEACSEYILEEALAFPIVVTVLLYKRSGHKMSGHKMSGHERS
jgi:hypothetical protein